jgi:membrane protease YdiL (CAAX protease family)
MSDPQAPTFIEARGLHPVALNPEAQSDLEAGPSESPGFIASSARLEVVDFEPLPQEFKPPGPGLPEAFVWSCGVFGAHAAATVLMLVVLGAILLVSILASGGAITDLTQHLAELSPSYLLLLAGGDQMLVLLATLAAVMYRFRGRVHQTLNLSAPRPLHLLIVVGLMLPLSIVCSENYRLVHQQWVNLTDLCPPLRMFDAANSVEAMQMLTQAGSLPLLLLVIAVAPAIGEELVFRGVIGRGLIARWGIVPGVLITSCLFAAVHFHPAHALAVVPLGIAMHLVYLGTRSFWAPVLLHFLNNAWATVASKMAQSDVAAASAADQTVSAVLLLASMTAVVVLAALLYRTRTRYVQADGQEWDPGYFTVEAPPDGQVLQRDFGSITGRNLLTAGSAWAAFGAAFVAEVVALAR